MNGFSGLAYRNGKGEIVRDMVAHSLQELQRQRKMQGRRHRTGFAR